MVGGNLETGRQSSIVQKLTCKLQNKATLGSHLYNGVIPNTTLDCDLIIWMPEISNEKPKDYPLKNKGACLICSKVIHGDRTEVDAISKIFDMRGNAVICIYDKNTDDNLPFYTFKLIDALGNVWVETDNLDKLAFTIMKFYKWSKGQIRKSYYKIPILGANDMIQSCLDIADRKEFIRLNTLLADKIENSLGSRYFGNFSTRCMKMFPSVKGRDNRYLFSPRNTDKKRLTVDDFVLVRSPHHKRESFYYGERKPSVDAPVQVKIYETFEGIKYIIHGHASIRHASTTKNYFPCGDLREYDEINNLLEAGICCINLKNHGFLIAAHSLPQMESLIREQNFEVNPFLRKEII